jgi:hypothetical protein
VGEALARAVSLPAGEELDALVKAEIFGEVDAVFWRSRYPAAMYSEATGPWADVVVRMVRFGFSVVVAPAGQTQGPTVLFRRSLAGIPQSGPTLAVAVCRAAIVAVTLEPPVVVHGIHDIPDVCWTSGAKRLTN